MVLTPGVTKIMNNGVEYVLTQHHRWKRVDNGTPTQRMPSQHQVQPQPRLGPRATIQQVPHPYRPVAAPKPKQPKLPSMPHAPTLPKHLVKLAASEGNTQFHRQARKAVSMHYLKNIATYYDHTTGRMQRLDEKRIKGMMDGIDLSKPVIFGPPPTIPPPEKMVQWQAEGGYRGSYFTIEGKKPQDLGIHDHAVAWNVEGKPVLPRRSKVYDTRKAHLDRVTYLHSIAAPTKDTWSIPGQTVDVKGGGEQWFIPVTAHPTFRIGEQKQ